MLERKVKKKQEIRIWRENYDFKRVKKENSQISDQRSEQLEEVREEVLGTSGG